MIEKYYLNKDNLPSIPTPHDCEIVEVSYEDDFLVFKFSDDLYEYDSIRFEYPNVKSLIIKYHLDEPEVYAYKWKKRLFGEGYELIDNSKIIKKHQYLEYWYHYVAYKSIILKLYESSEIILELKCDYVEYEWITGETYER